LYSTVTSAVKPGRNVLTFASMEVNNAPANRENSQYPQMSKALELSHRPANDHVHPKV
jgi:hypothetical protein